MRRIVQWCKKSKVSCTNVVRTIVHRRRTELSCRTSVIPLNAHFSALSNKTLLSTIYYYRFFSHYSALSSKTLLYYLRSTTMRFWHKYKIDGRRSENLYAHLSVQTRDTVGISPGLISGSLRYSTTFCDIIIPIFHAVNFKNWNFGVWISNIFITHNWLELLSCLLGISSKRRLT